MKLNQGLSWAINIKQIDNKHNSFKHCFPCTAKITAHGVSNALLTEHGVSTDRLSVLLNTNANKQTKKLNTHTLRPNFQCVESLVILNQNNETNLFLSTLNLQFCSIYYSCFLHYRHWCRVKLRGLGAFRLWGFGGCRSRFWLFLLLRGHC